MLIGVIAEEPLIVLVEPIIELASAQDLVDAFFAGAPIGLLNETANAIDVANAVAVYNTAIAEAATATSMQDAAALGVITGAVDEAATAASVQDATVTGAVTARSAMLPGVFVNSDTSREANVAGIMVNV